MPRWLRGRGFPGFPVLPGRAEPADRLLWEVAGYNGGWAPVLGVGTLAVAGAQLALPTVLGRTVDAVFAHLPAVGWSVLSVVLVLVIAGGDALCRLAGGAGTARATSRLRDRLLWHTVRLGPRATRVFEEGDLVSRVVGQAAESGQAGSTLVGGVSAVLPAAGSLVALALIDPWLGLVFACGLVLLARLLRSFVRDTSAVVTEYLAVQAGIASRLLDALGGIRTIAAAGTAAAETGRILEPLPRLRRYGTRMWDLVSSASTGGALIAPLLQIAVVAAAGAALAGGRISVGELFAASQYAVLGTGLGGTVMLLNRLGRARAGSRRAMAVLAEPAPVHGFAAVPPGAGRVELREVWFSGEAGPVLRGVNLVVPAGSSLAVVGASGSGKSVLAALAGRLLDPDAGRVLLDGLDLRGWDRFDLRTAVGYAFERPVLVGATVAEAIGLGRPEWTVERAARMAGLACADSFVDRLPDGYHTRLAEAPLSGGEIQRLGLARSARATRLLVLDDATSSVDSVTERQISSVLAREFGDRTRLIVAHRAMTAARADRVAWLQDGMIRAVAPHRELWADPEYRELFQPGGDR